MKIPIIFMQLHEVLFHQELSDEHLSEILELIQQDNCKLGDRYTMEHYAYCYKEVMMKHGYLRDNGNNTFAIIK